MKKITYRSEKKPYSRNVLHPGDIKYISGYQSSPVKIISGENEDRVLVEFLKDSPTNTKGTQKHISRRSIYPEGRR